MKRVAIAAGWLVGATVPLLVVTVWTFGCCVLPFHAVMHRLMPICTMAADFFGGDDAPFSTAPESREPVKRVVSETPRTFRLSFAKIAFEPASAFTATTYRSFIAFGALRCDRDVGLYLLDDTFRI